MKKVILFFLVTIFSISLFAVDIIPGQTYKISLSSDEEKVLSVKNSSLNKDADAVLWTETDVNSQRWIITKNSDDTYKLTNAYSEKILYRKSTAVDGSKVCQYDNTTSGGGKWNLIPVENKDGYFYITQMNQAGTTSLYLESSGVNNGTGIILKNKKEGADAGLQIWKLEATEAKPNYLTAAMQSEMMDGWKAKYYKRAPIGYVLSNGGWWGDAEMFEVVLDAYETTGNPEYETMFRELYKNFISRNRANWLYNEYNDDIAWMVIASLRAYLMFGDQNYLTYGKSNFDAMYSRALLPSGMLRWKETAETQDGTNSCINGPAEVAACYIAIATGMEEYYEKAKKLYALQRKYLYVPSTGQVYDSFTWIDGIPSKYNYWASTYNQGTFLGAAVMLYNHYGDEMYKKDAEMIMKYTAERMCDDNGIISVCQVATGDLSGFKGILMRYVRRFIIDMQQTEYVNWIQKNALHAYNNRNSVGVASSAWLTKAPENFIFEDCEEKCSFNEDPFGPSTAVSVAFNAPLDESIIEKNAFLRIEAENFNYIKGVHTAPASDDTTTEIGNIMNDFYTGYNHVNFGNNLATAIELRVSKATTRNSYIEIRLDSPVGDSIGRITVPREGADWQTITQEIIPVSGKRNIYLVYKGLENQNNLFKINWFRFKADSYIYSDITDNGGKITSSLDGKGLRNIIDNRLNTKFVVAKDANGNWIQYESSVPVALKGYALASADDASEKDPKAWKFQASDNGTDWTDIDTQIAQQFTARYQKKQYDISTANSYTYFRLLVTELNGSANELQLAEWQLFGSSVFENDITADGGTLSAQYNGNEPEETYVSITDKNAGTKYLVSDQSDLWIQYKSNGTYQLSSYSVTSASDTPERDPKDWVLYGSMDGKNWTVLDKQVEQKFNYRSITQYYTCNVSEGYQFFKLHITANNGAQATQFAEWQLFGKFYFDRFYNDITLSGGELSSSQDAEGNSAEIKALTDKKGNTGYVLAASELPAWIQYKSTIPAQLRAYSITVAGDKAKNPANWELQGSNDGRQWTNIHTRSNISFSKGERKTYVISPNQKYTYFRINITKLSDSNAQEVEIGEWELHGTGITTKDITSNNGVLEAEFAGLTAGEGLSKLTDNSENSKYCINFHGSAWVSYTSSVATKITAYSITSANDNVNRDPAAWTLEASTDGTEWEVIDSRENEVFPYRYVTQYYACNRAGKEFTQFRLNITGNNGAELLQIGEWQLLEIEGAGNNPNAIPDLEAGFDVSVYPNPVRDYLYIDMPEAGEIQLYNMSGQLMTVQNLSEGITAIPMTGYHGAFYLLRIISGEKVQTKLIIKQ